MLIFYLKLLDFEGKFMCFLLRFSEFLALVYFFPTSPIAFDQLNYLLEFLYGFLFGLQ